VSIRTYLHNAKLRAEARARLPRWVLLTLLFSKWICLAFTLVVFLAISILGHDVVSQKPLSRASEGARILVIFAPLIAALGPAFLLTNGVLFLFPSVRITLEKNAAGVVGASFREANVGLLWFTLFAFPLGLVLGIVGAVDPWD
jgi:hypothetical protein